jgi:hypothetical protein
MNSLVIALLAITAFLYFFVSPDTLRKPHLAMISALPVSAAAISFTFMYFWLYPMTGFSLFLWIAINSMVALAVNGGPDRSCTRCPGLEREKS